jgi:transcriptional regulator with XRE-family HTH domain
MTEETNELEWYQKLDKAIISNPEIKRELKEAMPPSSLSELRTGYTREGGVGSKKLESIRLSRRALLYRITGIEDFNPGENYEEPQIKQPADGPQLKDILSGKVQKIKLREWLDIRKISMTEVAKRAGISSKNIVRRFSQNKKLYGNNEQKITRALRVYESEISTGSVSQREQDSSPTKQQTPTHSRQISSNGNPLEEIAKGIEGLSRQVRQLGATYEPTAKERKLIVEEALDALIEQVDYYRNAPLKEREELANYLEVERWGWLSNVLGSISAKESPQTFARHTSAPKKTKGVKK